MEREGLVHFDVSVYQRRGGVPDQENAFRTCVFHFEPGVVRFAVCDCLKLQQVGQKLQEKYLKLFLLIGDPSPPLSTYRILGT